MKQRGKYLATERGFTLLELLVVVSILATMAGIGVSAIGGYLERAREELVHTEMKRIGEAVVQFNADTGYFPGEGFFAMDNSTDLDKSNFSFLFYSPVKDGVEILPWDSSTNRGWNGPYLTMDSIDYLRTDICSEKESGEKARIFPVNTSKKEESNTVIALEDTFERQVSRRDNKTCFAIRSKGREGMVWAVKKSAGKPYLYETHFKNDLYLECGEKGKGCIALLSAGKNGKYENGNNDDVVNILRVN